MSRGGSPKHKPATGFTHTRRVVYNQPAKPRRGGWAVGLLAFALLILLPAGVLVFAWAGGLAGVVLHLVFGLLYALGGLAGMVWMVRDRNESPPTGRTKGRGFAGLLLACATALLGVVLGIAWGILPAVRDLAEGPVTQQVEVVSFSFANRGRRSTGFVVQDLATGDQAKLRCNPLESYLPSLRPLRQAWRASRSGASVVDRRLDPSIQDGSVTCTITYYPHTTCRVGIEDIEVTPPEA